MLEAVAGYPCGLGRNDLPFPGERVLLLDEAVFIYELEGEHHFLPMPGAAQITPPAMQTITPKTNIGP